jgi:hypothetical protein
MILRTHNTQLQLVTAVGEIFRKCDYESSWYACVCGCHCDLPGNLNGSYVHVTNITFCVTSYIFSIHYRFCIVVKGPAAEATDAPQPSGALCNPVMKMKDDQFFFSLQVNEATCFGWFFKLSSALNKITLWIFRSAKVRSPTRVVFVHFRQKVAPPVHHITWYLFQWRHMPSGSGLTLSFSVSDVLLPFL